MSDPHSSSIILTPTHRVIFFYFFFFNDTATTEIYTPFPTRRSSDLAAGRNGGRPGRDGQAGRQCHELASAAGPCRSEEHTSELQSQSNLVCRLLLEKKKKNTRKYSDTKTQKSTKRGRDAPQQHKRSL